jgi:CHAD domain-containing protein
LKARKVKKLDPEAPLRENAARIVSTRLGELLSFASEALDPTASEAQHDMRIAAKRLRYVLEVTEECFGPEARRARKSAKELQSILGEIHDCDVMLPRVNAELEALQSEDARAVLVRAGGAEDLEPRLVREAPSRGAYRGLSVLAVHLRARRALLFERFSSLWAVEAKKGTWKALDAGLS